MGALLREKCADAGGNVTEGIKGKTSSQPARQYSDHKPSSKEKFPEKQKVSGDGKEGGTPA